MTAPVEGQLEALSTGRAYADLGAWWKTLVHGADARAWLGDLVTADVEGLEPGGAVRSLLLSPTGRLRADFTVAAVRQGFLLVQDPAQPARIGELLTPYVLSSNVSLQDRTDDLTLLAFPGAAPAVGGTERYAPSALGVGIDVVGAASDARPIHDAAAAQLVRADDDVVDAWRITRGAARLGPDLTTDSLPQEAGLDDAIAYAKGCFLGQEAVAKVRNLGHPPFVVLALRCDGDVRSGEAIVAGGEEVGRVTSAAYAGGASHAIGRVRWSARDGALRTASGATLRSLGPASGASRERADRR